jgi:hypothetical protein
MIEQIRVWLICRLGGPELAMALSIAQAIQAESRRRWLRGAAAWGTVTVILTDYGPYTLEIDDKRTETE